MSHKNFKKSRTKNKLNYSYPVVVVSRSNKNITAQVIEQDSKKTLFTSDSSKLKGISKTEQSKKVGESVAKFLNSKKISKVVFDRNGYVFHGRIKQVAESIKEMNITV
jgi:large subunit ribosomal protein L18